ncbi:MAG: YkgJ family cysteine cluster protein [Bacteroidota bacterium]
MQDILEKLPEEAQQKAAVHKKLFQKLKKKPPKHLDYLMQDLHDEVFSEIDCLQCANCCKTTGPLFTEADIDRIAKHFKMRPAQFVATYLRRDEDGDWVLQQLPCPFLGADHYCAIYEVRPKACREFPHTNRKKFHQIAHLTLKNVAICPAAFRIVEAMRERLPS